jgi:hypothetical protein
MIQKPFCAAVLAIVALLIPSVTAAETLYTINTAASTLIRIDSNNGHTSTVGSIGFEFHGADLAFLNGSIYAITAHADGFFADAGWSLLKIDPYTGQLLSDVEILLNGNRPFFMESLGSANGKLYVGFSPNGTVSTDVGELNPVTGAITSNFNYSAIPGVNNFFGSFGVDLDGMTGDPGNPSTLVALDTDANLISVVRINPVNVTVSPIAQFTVSSGIDDLAIGLNAPYMIGGGNLFRTNGGITGVAQTLALDPAGFYSGLTVPEPSSVALASFGLLGLVALGWRKAGRRAIG